MADDALTEEEYQGWLTPWHALSLVRTSFPDRSVAINALLLRLKGGALRAAAESWSVQEDGGTWNRAPPFVVIPAGYWNVFDSTGRKNNFWNSGDIQFYFVARRALMGGPRLPQAINYFSVRIDPVGLMAFLRSQLGEIPEVTRIASAKVTPQVSEEADAPPGPRISDDLLGAWLQLYQRAYAGTPQDTLSHAVRSAKGMFPDKSVARDRVHALFSGRKAGRKPFPKSK